MNSIKERKQPSIPSVPPTVSSDIRNFLIALRTAVQTLQGDGNANAKLDRAVTLRELGNLKTDVTPDSVVAALNKAVSVAANGGKKPTGDNTALDLFGIAVTAPTQPTGVRVDVALTLAILSWDPARYPGHAYTEIFRQVTDLNDNGEPVDPPRFDEATMKHAVSSSSVFTESIDPHKGYYYWVRHVNTNGEKSPLHATEGVFGKNTELLDGALIRAGTIVGDHIAAGSIVGSKIAADSIDGSKIAASTSIRAPIIEGGIINGITINGGTITGTDVYSSRLYGATGDFTGSIIVNNTFGPLLHTAHIDVRVKKVGEVSRWGSGTYCRDSSNNSKYSYCYETDMWLPYFQYRGSGSVTVGPFDEETVLLCNEADILTFNPEPQVVVNSTARLLRSNTRYTVTAHRAFEVQAASGYNAGGTRTSSGSIYIRDVIKGSIEQEVVSFMIRIHRRYG